MPRLHGSTANLAGQPSTQKEKEAIYKDIFDKRGFGDRKMVQGKKKKEVTVMFQIFKINYLNE